MPAPRLEQPRDACAIDTTSDRASDADVQPQLSHLEPLHRTVIMIDVASFSARDNRTQLLIRDQIYRMLGRAFLESGTNWTNWIREDRGDGVLIIVPPDVSKAKLLGPFPSGLATLLREHAQRQENAAFSLRIVIHAGDIVQDDHGHSGPAINLAARLLNAPVLRTVLASTSEPLVLAASDTIYDNIVRHGYDNIDPTSYQHARVNVKGTRASLWIHVPAARPPLRGIPRPRPIRVTVAAGVLALVTAATLLFTVHFDSLMLMRRVSTDDVSPTHRIDGTLIHSMPKIDGAASAQHCSVRNPIAVAVNQNGGEVLDVWDADQKNGAPVKIIDTDNGPNQQFIFRKADDGTGCTYELSPMHTLWKCIDAGDDVDGALVRLSECVGRRGQHWSVDRVAGGRFWIQSLTGENLCLERSGKAVGSDTWVATCHDANENQYWSLFHATG